MRKNMTDEERVLSEVLSGYLTTDYEAQVVVNFGPGGVVVWVEELDQKREVRWTWRDVGRALCGGP